MFNLTTLLDNCQSNRNSNSSLGSLVLKISDHQKFSIPVREKICEALEPMMPDSAILPRLKNCSRHVSIDIDQSKIYHADFCKLRLCPMCAWRRSMKQFVQMKQIAEALQKEGYRFLLLTLTVKNVGIFELEKAIDQLNVSFKRMYQKKKIKDVSHGMWRSLEITYNDKSNEWHPHIHALIVVDKSYFSRNYLKQEEWRELWEKCARLDYKSQVDIRAIKNDGLLSKAVAEVSKYAVKPLDLVKIKNKALRDEVIRTFYEITKSRRLVTASGLIKAKLKEFKMELDPDDLIDDTYGQAIVIMSWQSELKEYAIFEKDNIEQKFYKYGGILDPSQEITWSDINNQEFVNENRPESLAAQREVEKNKDESKTNPERPSLLSQTTIRPHLGIGFDYWVED